MAPTGRASIQEDSPLFLPSGSYTVKHSNIEKLNFSGMGPSRNGRESTFGALHHLPVS